MCSWCWGIAPALRQLQDHCLQLGLPFRVVVGGLRPGGGDPWNEDFKRFLAHHWQEIRQRTGQEFNLGILKLAAFNYDTEPACRSVVAARALIQGSELEFFSAVQRRFYVDNEDPKTHEFYRAICEDLNLDFSEFKRRFESNDVKVQTQAEFRQSRGWGVNGFPSVLLQSGGQMTTIATGFATYPMLVEKLSRLLPKTA